MFKQYFSSWVDASDVDTVGDDIIAQWNVQDLHTENRFHLLFSKYDIILEVINKSIIDFLLLYYCKSKLSTYYHAQLGLPNNGISIKGMFFVNIIYYKV